MINVISVTNMRESDLNKAKSVSSIELINKAANAIFNNVKWHDSIAIVCGTGNNASDGYALALKLKENGFEPILLLIENKFSKEGEYYFKLTQNKNIKAELIDENTSFEYSIIVDCLLGMGFHGEVNSKYKNSINKINESKAYVVSVDINSGLNGDNGIANIAVISDLTISLGQYKYGHYLNQAMDYMKCKINADIGINPLFEDAHLLEEADIKKLLANRTHYSNKGSYGYVGILGGSINYPGAIKLANMGQQALYSGCGVSRVIVPSSIREIISSNVLESTVYSLPSKDGNMYFDKEKIDEAIKGLSALSCGMGWGVSKENEKILSYLINILSIPLVIDADGLNNLANIGLDILNKNTKNIILTPHIKEFSRLIGKDIDTIKNNPIGYVKEFVNKYNVTLLLKGATTIIADRNIIYLVDKGTPGMATAGSGDVLTGIITGLLGYMKCDITLITAVAAYINGYAGEIASSQYGDIAMVSSDTARCVSKAIKRLEK